MRKLIAGMLWLALLAVPAFAGNVVTWNGTNALFLNSGSVTVPGLSQGVGHFDSSGNLSSSAVDLTSDVTGLLPNANLASIQFPDKKIIDFTNGNDTTGDGSAQRPWKTIQHACSNISPSINVPIVLYLTGGNNDSDSGTISCPPNIMVVSDYGIQISQPFTITGGSTNDTVTFTNITFIGNITWVRNDATAIQLTLNNSGSFGSLDFEQQGSGVAQTFLIGYGSNFTLSGLTVRAGETILQGIGLLSGTINYKDSGSSVYFYLSGSDIYNAAMTLNGGILSAFYGNFIEGTSSLTGVTTASGTPLIQGDMGAFPVPSGNFSYGNLTRMFQSPSANQPACSASTRGLEWLIQGGAGVADIYQICEKNASDAYVWTTH